jgi:DNA-binding beta-propeller fold protein YncE
MIQRSRSAPSCAILCLALSVLHPSPGTAQAVGPGGTLVVVNKGAGSASVIDVASGRTLVTAATGNGPHEVAISSDGNTAVVTDYGGRVGGNTLTVIDVPGLAVARTIDLGSHRRPHGIAFLPGDTTVAVTSEASRMVVTVRIADGSIVSTIPTEQAGSHMLALPADASRTYTSNGRDDSVSELTLDAGRASRIFHVPAGPEAIGVTPDGLEVWVGSNSEGTVSVIDTGSGAVQEVLSGFGWPYRIFISADGRLVLIPDLRGNELRIVDRASRTELAVLPLPGAAPQGITMSEDGRLAFLSLSRQDRVAVIDLDPPRVISYIETGSRPDGIGYTPHVFSQPVESSSSRSAASAASVARAALSRSGVPTSSHSEPVTSCGRTRYPFRTRLR